MKRLFISLLLLVPVMTFAGCGAGDDSSEIDIPEVPNDPGNDDDDNDNSGTVTPGNGKILIAWFSRWGNTNYAADVDATTGASILVDKGTRRGTTEMVARYIQTAVGGDLHLIETSEPYPTEFDDVRDQNHAEQAAGTLPALKNRIENMDQYDIVFIGYPNWALDVPQAIRSFLSSMTSPAKQSFRSVRMTDTEPAAPIIPSKRKLLVRMCWKALLLRQQTYLPPNRKYRTGLNESVSNGKSRRVRRFVLLPEGIRLPGNGSTPR